jgi:hypothetical protein
MESFAKFFDASKERFTPNTRKHHQNPLRGTNTKEPRKHLNQVAACYGSAGRKDDPLVDNIVKNNKVGTWNISPAVAKRLLSTYGIHHQNRNYSKAINRTGININFDSTKNRYTLSRLNRSNGNSKIS